MLAGALTLAIMVLPTILRTTEEALIVRCPIRSARGQLRPRRGQSCARCSASCCRPPCPASFSGIILAIGRIVGETAALILTAGTFSGVAGGVHGIGRTLAVHMYCLLNEGLHRSEAYATAVVLGMVIGINALSGDALKRIARRTHVSATGRSSHMERIRS